MHDGKVAVARNNQRWCSDGLEFRCDNGEPLRVTFALDCRDREATSWAATTTGHNGDIVRDVMLGIWSLVDRVSAIAGQTSPNAFGAHRAALARAIAARCALPMTVAIRRKNEPFEFRLNQFAKCNATRPCGYSLSRQLF